MCIESGIEQEVEREDEESSPAPDDETAEGKAEESPAQELERLPGFTMIAREWDGPTNGLGIIEEDTFERPQFLEESAVWLLGRAFRRAVPRSIGLQPYNGRV